MVKFWTISGSALVMPLQNRRLVNLYVKTQNIVLGQRYLKRRDRHHQLELAIISTMADIILSIRATNEMHQSAAQHVSLPLSAPTHALPFTHFFLGHSLCNLSVACRQHYNCGRFQCHFGWASILIRQWAEQQRSECQWCQSEAQTICLSRLMRFQGNRSRRCEFLSA